MAWESLKSQDLLIIEASWLRWHRTLDRTPLDEWSARRRDLYVTTRKTHNRETFMHPAGFEPENPASELPQTHALDSTTTGIGISLSWLPDILLNSLFSDTLNMCSPFRIGSADKFVFPFEVQQIKCYYIQVLLMSTGAGVLSCTIPRPILTNVFQQYLCSRGVHLARPHLPRVGSVVNQLSLPVSGPFFIVRYVSKYPSSIPCQQSRK